MERNKKISQLPSAAEFNDGDFLPIVQEEENKKLSKQIMFRGFYNANQIDQIINDLGSEVSEDTGKIKKDLADLEEDLRREKADKATTLAGYGITDAYTKTESDTRFVHPDDANLRNYYNKGEIYDRNYMDTNFITRAVEDLVNYYKKSETYTKEEVNAMVDAIPKFAITVVDELPTQDISESTIYLLRNNETGKGDNIFTEYIYSNNDWEVLGQQRIEMENYYDKNEINDMFANIQLDDYYTKEEIDQMLDNITVDLSDYYNKGEVDGLLDDKADKNIIVIGDSNITDETILVFESTDFIE